MKFSTLAITVLALVSVAASAPEEGPPPQAADFVGTWEGYTDSIEFLRLELDRRGSGYLAVTYISKKRPQLYRITHWRVVLPPLPSSEPGRRDYHFNIEFVVQPIDPDAEPVTLGPLMQFTEALEGEIRGHVWHQPVRLFSQSEWQSNSSSAKWRIARYRSTHRP